MTTIVYNNKTYVRQKSKTSMTELLLAGVVGFFGSIGTGGFTNNREALEHAAYIVPLDNDLNIQETQDNTLPLTISEQIKLIKNSFALNMSTMAELLKVSRPTVYAWIKGEPPKTQELIVHANFLTHHAKIYAELNLDRPDNFTKRPIFDGESLFSLLREEKQITESMYTLIKDLDTKESQTRANGLKKNELRTSDDILNDLA